MDLLLRHLRQHRRELPAALDLAQVRSFDRALPESWYEDVGGGDRILNG